MYECVRVFWNMCFVTVLKSDGSRVWRRDYLILSSSCRLLLGGRLISHACPALCYLWVCSLRVCVCAQAAKHSRHGNQLLTWWVVFQSFFFFVGSSLVRCVWNNTMCRISSESGLVLQGVVHVFSDNKRYCSNSHKAERLIEDRQAGEPVWVPSAGQVIFS